MGVELKHATFLLGNHKRKEREIECVEYYYKYYSVATM